MDESTKLLITAGVVLLLGLVADFLGRETRLPRVTLLLLLGVAIGPSVFDAVPEQRENWFPVIANLALVMIGFVLGGQFTRRGLSGHGRAVFTISLVESLTTASVVAAGLALAGLDLGVALLFGGIAAATEPAATAAVVGTAGRERAFPRILLGVVALDDVWGLFFFSLLAAAAAVVIGDGGGADLLLDATREIGGGVGLGLALALPMALLSGRLRPGEPTREEAVGIVLLCAGLAAWLDVSALLAAVVLGAAVANLASHHDRSFHEIEGIQSPVLVLFFVLSGASLDVATLEAVGALAVGYIVLRTAGKLGGAFLGARIAGADAITERWLGTALLAQAGVALGLALEAGERFPVLGEDVLPAVIASTVVFEIGGTLLASAALRRAERGA